MQLTIYITISCLIQENDHLKLAWVTQDGVGFLQVYRQESRRGIKWELAPMDGIRLLRYGTLVPVIYATPSL